MAGEQQPPECLLLQRRVHKARVPVLPHRSRLAHTRLSTMSAPVPKAEVLADPTEAETVRASEGGARSARAGLWGGGGEGRVLAVAGGWPARQEARISGQRIDAGARRA